MYRHLLAFAGLTTLAACSGNSNQTTIDLLRAGDAKVCIAADVESALRKLVFPKVGSSDGYTITFSDATLETFDKVVSKVSCHANIKIDGPSDEIVEKTGFDFTVVPSAQDPKTFVIGASLKGFAERLADTMQRDTDAKEQEASSAAEQATLKATVKEGWLLGRWVSSQLGSDACLQGPYSEFARNHRYNAVDSTGTWKLSGLTLNVIGTGSAVDLTINEADQDTFTADAAGAEPRSFRRCTRAEATPPPGDDADADADEPGDTSGIDAENPTSTVR